MVSRSRNLSLKAKGQDVRLFQNKLSKIGYVIDSREQTEMFFGKTTKKAVEKFQLENGLKITGKIDNDTANKINKILKSEGRENHQKATKSLKKTNRKPTKSELRTHFPRSLLESDVYFKSLEDNMDKLKNDEARYINQKLNAYFQNELNQMLS